MKKITTKYQISMSSKPCINIFIQHFPSIVEYDTKLIDQLYNIHTVSLYIIIFASTKLEKMK